MDSHPYFDLTPEEQQQYLLNVGAPSFAHKQIDDWFFKKHIFSFEHMTNLRMSVREKLRSTTPLRTATHATRFDSSDGTIKCLLELDSDSSIECVAIPYQQRLTFCISTMAGCPVGCVFCASGAQGLDKMLTPADMITQYAYLTEYAHRPPSNLVIMGMGEPLLNYENLITFLHDMRNPSRAHIGARHITISTIGIPNAIRRLANEGAQFELAFSLHHPFQKQREKLIPFAKKFQLSEIEESLIYYTYATNRRITIEYCLIKGINDSMDCARGVSQIARRLRAKVNLIPHNPWNSEFEASAPQRIQEFSDSIEHANIPVTIRQSRGQDIQAACGQLRLSQKS